MLRRRAFDVLSSSNSRCLHGNIWICGVGPVYDNQEGEDCPGASCHGSKQHSKTRDEKREKKRKKKDGVVLALCELQAHVAKGFHKSCLSLCSEHLSLKSPVLFLALALLLFTNRKRRLVPNYTSWQCFDSYK